ncbi:MAG: reductase [Actinoplanes sp.]|jgi:FMN reductase|nr:reductase [Actinoplanes sp.]
MPDVVVISGHPQPGSRTLQLARAVGERLAGSGAVDIAELVPALFAPADGATGEALLEVQDATLLVVATPTYRGSYTGALKVFLDQLPANALAGVVAVPVVTAEFQPHADAAEAFLARLLRELGADVVDFGLTATESELADPGAIADQYTAAIST